MLTTTRQDVNPTITQGGKPAAHKPNELVPEYQDIVAQRRLSWTNHLQLLKLLGSGGQGVVYQTELRGTDNFTLPAALKIFSPERFDDVRSYDEAMQRVARASARVAQIQHDNLLYVYNFVDRHRIRMMVMEWIDGYDLARLLVPKMLERIRHRVSHRRWEYVNQVIVTAGPTQPRMKAGVAVAIVRDCLNALAALHRHGIVHGDIKPSNIMLKRTGITKIVDIGSAFELRDPPRARTCTLAYAAPEVLENRETTPRSDLCSLGYVLIELLSGRQPFNGTSDIRELLEAKRAAPAAARGAARGSAAVRALMYVHQGDDRRRPGPPLSQRRGGRAAQGRRRRVPPATGHWQSGQRVRQRHSPLARRAQGARRPGRRPQRGGLTNSFPRSAWERQLQTLRVAAGPGTRSVPYVCDDAKRRHKRSPWQQFCFYLPI